MAQGQVRGKAACLLLLAATVTALVAGCSASKPSASQAPAAVVNFDAAWDASLDTLKDYQFELDRRDRREGLITTFPMTGKSWFEYWRKDSASTHDTLESTLQTIYHTAIVKIERTDRADTFKPTVQVLTARSSRPTPQVTNTSEAYELFNLTTDPQRERFLVNYGEGAEAAPTALPDDIKLAAKIQADIEGRLAKKLGR